MAIRARVESVLDPLKLGRIKIRVPGLHGDSAFTPTEALPYASYVSTSGGFDSGSFVLPEVGSVVLAEKEDNDGPWFYLGVVRGTGTMSSRGQEVKWITDPSKPEVPHDSEGSYLKPVIYKSIKGATIRVDERDGEETVDILAHNGTTIRMVTPLEKPYDGHKTTRVGRSIDTEIGVGESCVVIKDGVGNTVRLLNTGVMEFVGNGKVKSGVNLNSDLGTISMFAQSDVRTEVSLTTNSVVATNGKASFKIQDGIVEMDGEELIQRFSKITSNASEISIASNSATITGDSVSIGGGTVNVGPSTNLGASISKGSVASKVVAVVGNWLNNVLPKYGGDKVETNK